MIQNYSKWLVLREFFDDPEGGFTIRLLSKKIGLAATSVKLHLDNLLKDSLILKESGVSYPVYKANRENEIFRFYKKIDMLFRIKECGLVEKLEDAYPQAIILFGSAARGEDDAHSDIDLFLLCKEKKTDLQKFEKALKRAISLHFSEDLNKLPKELRNNIINGIKLAGYIEIF